MVAAARLAASGGTSPAEVVELVRRQIVEVFGVDDCRFDPGLSHPDRPRLRPDESITWRGTLVDVEREGLPTLDLLELPVTWAGVERGALLLTSTSAMRRPGRGRRQVAVAFADQAAALSGAARHPVDDDTGQLRSS